MFVKAYDLSCDQAISMLVHVFGSRMLMHVTPEQLIDSPADESCRSNWMPAGWEFINVQT